MAHSEKCPICLGKGEVIVHDVDLDIKKQCIGCSGKGWIIIPDENFDEESKTNEELLLEVPENQKELLMFG